MTSSKIWFERRKNENENNKSKKDKKKIILNLCLVILLLSLPLVTTQTVHAGCWTKCDTCTRTVCDTCYKTVVCEKKKVCQTCYKPECDTYKKTVCEVRYKLECTTCKKTFSSTCYRKVPYTCKKTECKLSIGQPCSGCSCRYYGLIQGIPSWVCCYEKKYTCYRLEPYKCTRHETYTCCHRKPYKYCYEIRYKYNCHLKPYPCKCREYYDCRKVPYKCNCHKETYPCNCRRICEPLSVTILGLHDGATLGTTKNTVRLPVTVKVTGGNGWAFIGVLVDGQVKYFERVGSGTTRTIWLTLPPGTHTITAKAWDFDGNKNSKSIRVTVIKNSPPSVAIFEPRNGETLKTTGNTAKVLVKARITDDYGLFMTVMFVDGHLKDIITKSQKAITYTKRITLSPGTHTITIKAYDKSGMSSEKSVRVTVIKNEPPSVIILEPRDGETVRTTGNTAKIPIKVRATDDSVLMVFLMVYVDGHLKYYDFVKSGTTRTIWLTLSPGTHTVTVEARDMDKASSKSSITIKVLRALKPSDVSVFVTYQNNVPLLLEKLPVRITIKKPPGDTLIQIYLQKKRTKVLMKQDTCYNTVCAYDLELPLTDFLNIPHASIAYKLLVTFDKDFTVEKTITLTRGSYFATGKEITLIYTIEKGTGPIKDIYLLYNGKKIHPLRYPKELHQQEELTVNVPFKVKVTNTAYATIVVCNYYGCDYRTVKILGTGSTPPPPPPPVIPTPRPTPKPTVTVYITPTPKPTPKPTPPPTPTRPGVNVVKVSIPEISWSHEYSKGGVPTVGK